MIRKKALVTTLVVVATFFAMSVMAQPVEDIQKFSSCKYCGMDRQKFAHSRMLVEYDDGSAMGTCSIHCSAMDMALNIDKGPKAIMVGDYNTKKLIDAEKATWVIGGQKPGVMTKNAKWAFAENKDAEAFLRENGGRVGTFEDALKATFEDMASDIKMIREKRAKMKMMKQEGNK